MVTDANKVKAGAIEEGRGVKREGRVHGARGLKVEGLAWEGAEYTDGGVREPIREWGGKPRREEEEGTSRDVVFEGRGDSPPDGSEESCRAFTITPTGIIL